jgi:hypothetical protein
MVEKKTYPETLTLAILQVMDEVKSIEKRSEVGDGKNKFLAVSDKDVKQIIQPAMVRAGLTLLTSNIEKEVKIERWKALDYSNKEVIKQQVFTEVKVTYILSHVSGGEVLIQGYGQGVDPQDKGAGKATTYALKYALLYTFIVPTGLIDDTDKGIAPDAPATPTQTLSQEQFNRAIAAINTGDYTKEVLKQEFALNKDQLEILETINA